MPRNLGEFYLPAYPQLPAVVLPRGAKIFVEADGEVYRSDGVSWQADSPRQAILNYDSGLRKYRAQQAALDAGENVKPVILGLGDSITEGAGGGNSLAGGANWRDLGYIGQLRSIMAARWGDVGTGFIAPYSWEMSTGSPAWTKTGTGWSYDATFGAAGRSLLNNFGSGTNSTATVSTTFSGTGVLIHLMRGSITCKVAVYIDGTLNTTFDSYNATNQHYALQITGLADGAHTLELRYGGPSASNAGATYLWLIGATPIRGTRGMLLQNLGYWGKQASDFAGNTDNLIDAIDIHNPSLTIIAFGANEYANQQPLATYEASLQALITRARNFGDVLLVATGFWNDRNPTITRSQYVAVMRRLAIVNGVAFADLEAMWGDGATATALGMVLDNVHPNTRGHRALTLFLSEILGLGLPTGVVATGGGPPAAHKATHAIGGTDALSPADIGALPASAGAATNLDVFGYLLLNDVPIYLRKRNGGVIDANHRMQWVNLWGGVTVDGPMLIGYAGGGFGSTNNGTGEKTILRWDNNTAYLNEVQIATITPATPTTNGLMLAADKARLDSLNRRSAIVAAVTGGSNSTADVVFASLNIPANTLAVSDQLWISAAGTTNNGTTATTITYWVRIGGTKINLGSYAMGTTAATGTSWVLDAILAVRTIGVTGTLSVTGWTARGATFTPSGGAQSTAKSTAASLLVEVGATMSVANASNSVTAQQASIALT